ncbi:MAG: TonB-dependent hemoglobin/transferrin/lactoferrin family receptor [Pontibacterium sp.]
MKRKALVVGVSLASAVTSQANDAPVMLDELVITASRYEQSLEESNRIVEVVSDRELNEIQAQSVAEAAATLPNVSITGGPRSGYQAINIRGLEGDRVLQLVDGVRQDFSSGHRPTYFLDAMLLKQIEVLKGPSSSLWGSGAIGGVVSQKTIDAADLVADGQSFGGKVKSSFNFNNDQSSNVAALAGEGQKADWLLSAYYRHSNDAVSGDKTVIENSGSEDLGFLGKTTINLAQGHELAVNLRHSAVEGAVPSNGSSNVNGTSVFLIDKDQANNTVSVGYRYTPDSPLFDTQVFTYFDQVNMDEKRTSDGRADSTEEKTVGINVNNRSVIGATSLIYGFDGSKGEFDTVRGGTNRPTPPDATIDLAGVFIDADIALSEAWSLSLGGRYDYFGTKAANLGTQTNDNSFSPSAALVWQANEALKLTARHDRAFRAPGAEELYSTGTHFCYYGTFCNTFVSNPNLQAEEAANTELAAQLNINDGWVLKGSVFENNVDNFIEQVVEAANFVTFDAGTTYWRNVDQATLRGFEVGTYYSLNDLDVDLVYAQTRGKNDASGEALNNIPADTWKANVRYHFVPLNITAGARVTYAEDQLLSTSTTYDGYTLTDLYASWKPARLKGVSFDLAINNFTNANYRTAWANIDEAGREVILSATVPF